MHEHYYRHLTVYRVGRLLRQRLNKNRYFRIHHGHLLRGSKPLPHKTAIRCLEDIAPHLDSGVIGPFPLTREQARWGVSSKFIGPNSTVLFLWNTDEKVSEEMAEMEDIVRGSEVNKTNIEIIDSRLSVGRQILPRILAHTPLSF